MKPSSPSIHIGPHDERESVYSLIDARVLVRDHDHGGYQQLAVQAELTINHMLLRRLVEKAYGNKSKRSSDGPLEVRIVKDVPVRGG